MAKPGRDTIYGAQQFVGMDGWGREVHGNIAVERDVQRACACITLRIYVPEYFLEEDRRRYSFETLRDVMVSGSSLADRLHWMTDFLCGLTSKLNPVKRTTRRALDLSKSDGA